MEASQLPPVITIAGGMVGGNEAPLNVVLELGGLVPGARGQMPADLLGAARSLSESLWGSVRGFCQGSSGARLDQTSTWAGERPVNSPGPLGSPHKAVTSEFG